MKKVLVLSAFALLSTRGMHAMCGAGRPYVDDIPKTDAEKELKVLDDSTDPNRYGQLKIPTQITSEDKKEAMIFMEEDRGLNLYGYKRYRANRDTIAKAVMCGQYSKNFMGIALLKNDLPLLKHLIAHRQLIGEKTKEQVKFNNTAIDILSEHPGHCSDKPLGQARSLEATTLLVENGASIEQQVNAYGESAIHLSCMYDRSPAILKYCLKHYPAGANSVDKNGNTPLHKLCEYGFGYPLNAEYLPDVMEKFTALKNAGANPLHKNKQGETPLDMVESAIKSGEYHQTIVNALSQLGAHIQRNAASSRFKLQHIFMYFAKTLW